jgi:hypothetical protein
MLFQPKGTVSKNPSRVRKPALFPSKKKRAAPTDTKKRALKDAVQNNNDQVLRDLGLENSKVLRIKLAPGLSSTEVVALLEYIPQHMFSDIPTRAAGMNSTRISEVLNFRLRLPPVVSVANIHALCGNATSTEREIAFLVQRGVVRKISIPGRGTGASAVGDGVVLVSEWIKLLEANNTIAQPLKEKYITHLRGQESESFSPDEFNTLTQEGFLTGSSMMPSVSDTYLQPARSSLGSLNYVADAGAKNAAGSNAAAATTSVQYIHGGKTSGKLERHSQSSYRMSLPNVGPLLRLLPETREHLVHLLSRSGSYKALSLHRLKELWDGNLIDFDAPAKERKGVLPAQMKKWRQFYGVTFEFVLAECLGAGLVECFRTGGVGTGVRVV